MAEELAFEQRLGQGGAVHFYEGADRPVTVIVYGMRHQLFAGAAFSVNQNGRVAVGREQYSVVNLLHHVVLAYDAIEFVSALEFFFQTVDFGHIGDADNCSGRLLFIES